MATLARMRTQAQALAEVKAMDPNTALTAHALRQLILQEKIKFVCIGNKRLVNLDYLLEYLADPPDDQKQDEEFEVGYGKLRKIKV